MSQDLLISVIACTYNRGNHLPKIIDLLLSQDYPKEKFEIIVVDNGSTDNTENMVERF